MQTKKMHFLHFLGLSFCIFVFFSFSNVAISFTLIIEDVFSFSFIGREVHGVFGAPGVKQHNHRIVDSRLRGAVLGHQTVLSRHRGHGDAKNIGRTKVNAPDDDGCAVILNWGNYRFPRISTPLFIDNLNKLNLHRGTRYR